MSFSNDLWNGFDFIYKNFNERRKGLKQFLFMLSEKHDHENELAKGIKRIFDYNYSVLLDGTLASGMSGFKNDLMKQYTHMSEHVTNMMFEILEPLRNFIDQQTTSGRKLHSEYKELEREFKYTFDHLEKSKLRFHSCARSAEEAKLQSEIAKTNPNLSSDMKNKYVYQAQLSLREAKEAEKFYIEDLNMSNNYRDKYITATKKILDEFQAMEEKYLEFTRDCLRRYFEFQFILQKNLSSDYQNRIKIIEGVNTQADMKDFIEKNSTNSVPPFKFEFIPYASDVHTKYYEQAPYPLEIINNVKSFITKAFHSEMPEVELDPQEAKINIEIQGILNLAWEGRIQDEDKKIVIRLINPSLSSILKSISFVDISSHVLTNFGSMDSLVLMRKVTII